MTPNLEVLVPEKWAGQTLPLAVFPYLIGRDEHCTLRATSQTVSRRHCCLLDRQGGLSVRDFNSTNGTYVNNQPIVGERQLHDGDRLGVGPYVFAVHIPYETGEEALTAVTGDWLGASV